MRSPYSRARSGLALRPVVRRVLVGLLAAGLLLGFAWLVLWSPAAHAQGGPAAGEHVRIDGKVSDNVYAAGSSVDVSATAGGDVVAAGGNVELTGDTAHNVIAAGGNVQVGRHVGQDVLAAGGNVEVRGRVDDDVRAAGGSVQVDAIVGGELVAAGGRVAVVRTASVAGRAWLAGSDVELQGTVGKDVRIRARDVRLDGTVRGNVDVEAETLVVGPAARIAGRLVYASQEEARIDAAARIEGGVERTPLAVPPAARGIGWGGIVLFFVLVTLALVTTATVLRYVFPKFSVQTARILSLRPWKSLALGFALFVCIPAAMVVLFITLIGIPLGLALLLLYPLALGLGKFVAAVWIAETLGARLFGRQPQPIAWQVGLLWLAVVLLSAVLLIPWLGWLIEFAALLFGLGALGLHLAARYVSGGAAPTLR